MNSTLLYNTTNTTAETDCLAGVFISQADRYIFWIGGFVTLLATFFVMLSSYKYKEVRKQPGDLILGIVASDFVLALHWILTAIWYKKVDNKIFCGFLGILGSFAGINEFLYNVSFSLYLIITLKSTLKASSIPKNRFHIVNLSLSTFVLIFLLAKNEIGKTLSGTCSLRAKCSEGVTITLAPILALIYFAIGSYTYYYIQKNVPKCQRVHHKRSEFLLYYLRYIIASTLLYSIIALFNIIYTFLGTTPELRKKHQWMSSLFNFAKVCSPIILSFIRFNDPMIKKAMIKTFFFWKVTENRKSRGEPLLIKSPDAPDQLELEDIPSRRGRLPTNNPVIPSLGKRSSINSFNSQGSLEEFAVNELSLSKKMEIAYTLLSSVLYTHHLEHEIYLANSQLFERRRNAPYKHQVVYLVDEKAITNALPPVKKELERTKYNILPGTLKIYCPEIFTSFLMDDRDFLDIVDSLDFQKNKEQIKSASEGAAQGGKSGEFFFFSADKKLIIKTVPDSEIKMLASILSRLQEHYQSYPNSLIAKVYGAITYENTDEKLRFNLIVMKNVCGFPSKFVERVYDLKGSKYDREVLKGKDVRSRQELKNYVLKDLDFARFEGFLNFRDDIKQSFLQQVEIDSKFFRDNYLIDYSFMVFYVNKQKYRDEKGDFNDFTLRNPLASLECIHERGVFYNIGIIDYLQAYTYKKMLEKYFKRLLAFDSKLETSSQDPQYYSDRFIKFISKILGEPN